MYAIRFRKKKSTDEWEYYVDKSLNRCKNYLFLSNYKDDLEYEIYGFLSDGVMKGRQSICSEVPHYTIKEYLFDKYKCDNLDILSNVCPVDINLLDLSSPVTERFKKALEHTEKQKVRNINKRKRLRLHIDSRVEKTLIISEKDDQSKLSIFTSINSQDKKRNVYYLTIEDIESNRFIDDKRGIYIVNCNCILGDGRKLTSLIYEANLVATLKDNKMSVIKDRYNNARGFINIGDL